MAGLLCTNGHQLAQVVEDVQNTCAGCGAFISAGHLMMKCDGCQFHACTACTQKELAAHVMKRRQTSFGKAEASLSPGVFGTRPLESTFRSQDQNPKGLSFDSGIAPYVPTGLPDQRTLSLQPFQQGSEPPLTMSSMRGLLGEYNSGIRNDINAAMGDLRKDVKEELLAIRVETRNEFSKVRSESKIAGDGVRSDLAKMDERLKQLESRPKKGGNDTSNDEGADRDLQIVASGWVEEKTEKEIVETVKKFLVENELQEKVSDVFCFRDPCNFGIIECHSIRAARSFLRKLKDAKGFEIEGEEGRQMGFATNRTLPQRAQDKRLGQIKHQMFENGIPLEDIKILWRKNIVKAYKKPVYKLSLRSDHIYRGDATAVKASVEEFVKKWLEARGEEDSD